jgi:uncharacterized protein
METGLLQKLNNDLKQSLRERDEIKTSTLRLLISNIKYAELRKQDAEFTKNPNLTDSDLRKVTLSEPDILAVIAREIKQREESIEAFKKGNRQDLVDKESAEMAVLKLYMPQQMTRDEIFVEARQMIGEVGAKGPSDKGKVMSKLVARLKGKADGREINEIVTDLLGKM